MIKAETKGGKKAKAMLEAMRARVSKGSGSSVRVGVPDGATESDGSKIAVIAATHEFGSPERGIPPRPFLAPSIIDSKAEIAALNKTELAAVVSGKRTVDESLSRTGAVAAGKVQQYIRNGSFAPLKEATKKRKGSSKPLIDTGNLVQSITFEVRMK